MHANRFWIATKSTRFWSGWWLAMKNGALTTTWSAKGSGRKAVRLPRRWPSLGWRPGRFFCVFGGIGLNLCFRKGAIDLVEETSQSSTISCSAMVKRSIRTCTANNWTASMQHSCRRGHLWSTEAELSSIRTTPGHTHLWWRARSSGSPDLAPDPDLAPSDYHLFLSMANELGSRKLATRESCENWLSEFFDNRKASFYKFYYEVGISFGTRHRTKRAYLT